MDGLNGMLVKLCGVATLLMVAAVALGILVRFVFSHLDANIGAPWTEEVSRYLMIWTVFIGGAVAARSGKLIGVEAMMLIMPPALGRAAKYLSHLMSVAFYIVLCWVGWQWLEFGQSQTSPVMRIPLAGVNTAMLVGGALLVLNTLALIVEAHLTGKDIRHATLDDELESALAQVQTQEARP